MLSFKDFTPVQYTDSETEMQDRYAHKRHRGIVGESSTTIEKIRERMEKSGIRRARRRRPYKSTND